MDLERAIDTQRDALLRLLARLLFAVQVVSCGPFRGRVPRWVSWAVSSILDRAEMAAGYLIIASVRAVMAKGVMSLADRTRLDPVTLCGYRSGDFDLSPDEAVSAQGLLSRIRALKALLENLPHYARRALARHAQSAPSYSASAPRPNMTIRPVAAWRHIAQRIERPPDKIA